MKYLGEHHDYGSAPTWKFLAAVTAGQTAGMGAVALMRLGRHDACSTQSAKELFVSTGIFWLVGGLSWIALTRKS